MAEAALKQKSLEPEDLPEGSPERMVATYLRTMEARDFDTARTMLAPDFEMLFPGARRYTKLEDLAAFSKSRYTGTSKTFERFEVAETPDGTVVFSIGTLQGKWLDESPYSGIRYIDRFLIRGGKFAEQWVWNDMAEMHDFHHG